MQVTTLAEQVVEQLRDDIFAGVYKPGDNITVSEIAKKYEVSTIPVREAFQYLSGEQLLKMQPHRGATVVGITDQYIHDVFEIDAVIQAGFCMRALAAHGVLEENIKELERIGAELEAIHYGDEDYERRFVEKNAEFHAVLTSNTDNMFVEDLSRKYTELMNYFTSEYCSIYSQERKEEIDAQHRRIIETYRAGDAYGLSEAILQHRDDTIAVLTRNMHDKVRADKR